MVWVEVGPGSIWQSALSSISSSSVTYALCFTMRFSIMAKCAEGPPYAPIEMTKTSLRKMKYLMRFIKGFEN